MLEYSSKISLRSKSWDLHKIEFLKGPMDSFKNSEKCLRIFKQGTTLNSNFMECDGYAYNT